MPGGIALHILFLCLVVTVRLHTMGVTHLCFGLSYLTALLLEMIQAVRPNRWLKVASLLSGGAGLVAHTLFLLIHKPSPASAYGSLLLLAWVFAVFYLIGSLHRDRPWGVFVLPLVIALVVLSFAFKAPLGEAEPGAGAWYTGDHFWGAVHGGLILAASVGITVAFLASVMYLLQSRRLRQKRNPIGGMKLLSLERLETMSRRGINIAFPLLTAGLLLGLLLAEKEGASAAGWATPKVIGTVGLWLLGVLLLYLRYGAHLAGRRLALLTIAAFGLLLLTLVASHPFAHGDLR
jgi:ABC-type transport system involved in cytochrome c biogenesis permease subunit